jgi:mono/diheme cytochrome c family protein
MKLINRTYLLVLAVTLVLSAFAAAQSGGDLYKSKCAMCHGASGAGDTAMGKNLKLRDLGSDDVQKQSDADLANIITNGKDKMPKYDGKLTKDQVGDVVKYIRSLKK